jgi:hypothetical protein
MDKGKEVAVEDEKPGDRFSMWYPSFLPRNWLLVKAKEKG